jgi:regulator of sigma E protease
MEIFLIKAAQLIAALALLVLIHEFGHFIFARIFGIKVDKFYLFFNPGFSLLRYNPRTNKVSLFIKQGDEEKHTSDREAVTFTVGKPHPAPTDGTTTWRDTVYGIGWLPLGGYCAINGMIDESNQKLDEVAHPWEFRTKPAWQRLLVMIGGVLFNFLLAIVIYSGIAYNWGEKTVRFQDAYAGLDYVPAAHSIGFQDGDIPLTADGIAIDGTEQDAGLRLAMAKQISVLRNGTDTITINVPDDFIYRINDDQGFYALRMPVQISQLMPGDPAAKAELKVGDRFISVGDSITPSYSEFTVALQAYAGTPVACKVIRNGQEISKTLTPTEGGKIGIGLAPITDVYPIIIKHYSLLQSIPQGWKIGTGTLCNYVKSMKLVFSKEGAKSLGGFGALGSIFPDKWDWLSFWYAAAFLSVALAFMNIIPIPALDGGHVLFLIYEIVVRRKPSEKFMVYAQYAGMAFLFALLIFANGNDIYRFLIK